MSNDALPTGDDPQGAEPLPQPEPHHETLRRIAARDPEADAAEIARLRREIASQALDVEGLRDALVRLQASAAEVEQRSVHLEAYLALIRGTIGWRLLERLRRVRDGLMPAESRRGRGYQRLRSAVASLFGIRRPDATTGPAVAATQTTYDAWMSREEITTPSLAVMTRQLRGLADTSTISVITAVHDVPPPVLRRMLDSVKRQAYPHWQLCVATGPPATPAARAILAEYADADTRILVAEAVEATDSAEASNRAARLATGEFLALVGPDAELPAHALFELARRLNEDPQLDVAYSDEDTLDGDGHRVDPFFKPGWSPDLLLSMNYVGRLLFLRRSLFEAVGGFRPDFAENHDYDLILRATERTTRIAHIPKVLYHSRRAPAPAVAPFLADPESGDGALRTLAEALSRRGLEGSVETVMPGRYSVRYRVQGAPLVSIIIPTRDRVQLLRQCVESIEQRTDHSPFELVLVDNDSKDPAALAYLDSLRDRYLVCVRSEPFNFSRLNNFAATRATGHYLLFLNNDTQVISKGWLTAMLEQAQRPDVGVVGAKLLYTNRTIQHAGVVLGIGGVAGHAFKHVPDDRHAYFGLPDLIRNCSAVTGACMMVSRRVFDDVGGFDEHLGVAFNDVDLCFRIREHGYLIVYTPRAVLYHAESASRQMLHPPAEEQLMWRRWGDAIRAGDPYYNPNLTRTHEDWAVGL